MFRSIILLAALAIPALAQPPRVASMSPDHGDTGVDPALGEIRVEFDQDMAPGSQSICGGGPRFPTLTARPRWEGARIIHIPVHLEPDHVYELSINCPSSRNFRSAAGRTAEITPLLFRTAAAGAPALPPPTHEEQAAAFDAMRKAIDLRYSYRDLRVHDWEAAFAAHHDEILAAPTRAAFARAAARLLAAAGDLHMALAVGEARFATFRANIRPNIDPPRLERLVPGFKRANDWVTTGRFDDGTAYLGVAGWPADQAALAPAHGFLDDLKSAKGLILDVRANGGGDEPEAQRLASRFVSKPGVYSRNRYRDGAGGWGPVLDRTIEPAARGRVEIPVVVLMGRGCVSSNESFLLMMRHGARAKLVGEPSYGSSANPRPVDLGNGVTLVLPSWEDMLPDGTVLEGKGVEPDLGARLGDDAARDGVLEAGLAALRR